MKCLRLLIPALFAAGAAFAAAPKPAPLPSVDIPYEKFVLANGLTLIVHEDHKAPVVAVNVWYHVGSGREALLGVVEKGFLVVVEVFERLRRHVLIRGGRLSSGC